MGEVHVESSEISSPSNQDTVKKNKKAKLRDNLPPMLMTPKFLVSSTVQDFSWASNRKLPKMDF